MLKKFFVLLFGSLFVSNMTWAVQVTVYNENLGLVKEKRKFNFKRGINEINVTDVAAQIDPTSVHFKTLGQFGAVQILEQNFQYDLIDQNKILEKYIGEEIELERFKGQAGKREVIRGTLLSNKRGRVMKVNNKIYLNPPGNPILPELPEGLLTRPTLQWLVRSNQKGAQTAEISYLTSGMGWSADYVTVVNSDDTKMDLNAWVTLNNNSGATYKNAKLKLVAGDVNRVQKKAGFGRAHRGMLAMSEAAAPQFQEKSFFEYHLYTLERPTTLKDNETKQIEMASAAKVPIKKMFIFDGGRQGNVYYNNNSGQKKKLKVWVVLEFKNNKTNNLGIPLPKGRVRVYKADEDGSLEFIGEDAIDHTPKNETVRVKMGNAFDVVGERVKTNQSSGKRWSQESYQIKIKNRKDQKISVKVVERLTQARNWKVLQSNRKYKKKDAQTIEFHVPVAKNGQSVVTYTVKYSW